jgi:hypothetical protein
VKSAKVTTLSPLKTHPMWRMGKRTRGDFSYGPGSADLDFPIPPLIDDPSTTLEASLPASPRRPHNVEQKRVAKKLKVTETTSQEVSSSSRVVEYLS